MESLTWWLNFVQPHNFHKFPIGLCPGYSTTNQRCNEGPERIPLIPRALCRGLWCRHRYQVPMLDLSIVARLNLHRNSAPAITVPGQEWPDVVDQMRAHGLSRNKSTAAAIPRIPGRSPAGLIHGRRAR